MTYLRQLNPGVQSLIKWQFEDHGGFFTALWMAISRADEGNLQRLGIAFPEEVRAYIRFKSEPGYWEHILEELRKPEVIKGGAA
jgi:hypothetical protein